MKHVESGEKKCQHCKKRLVALEKQVAENLAGWKRAKADYKNLQAQSVKEKTACIKFANEQLLMEMLPIVDYFKYAFKDVPKEQRDSPWMTGMNHIYDQYIKVLEGHGVEIIKTVGEMFDPERHESIEMVETDGESGRIIEEMATGFTLNTKVIQPAKVKIIK